MTKQYCLQFDLYEADNEGEPIRDQGGHFVKIASERIELDKLKGPIASDEEAVRAAAELYLELDELYVAARERGMQSRVCIMNPTVIEVDVWMLRKDILLELMELSAPE